MWTQWVLLPCSAWVPTPTAGQHLVATPMGQILGGQGRQPEQLLGPSGAEQLQMSGPLPPHVLSEWQCNFPTSSRNPDKDERPWCYVVKDNALSWEYCRLAACGAGAAGWGGAGGGGSH
jgi:hypothetical protein